MTQLQFSFSLNQTNTILKALNQLPYGEVCELIQQIHNQASPQLDTGENEQVVSLSEVENA